MAVVSPVCVHVFSVDGEGACTNVYVCICVCACLLLNIFSSKSQLCCVTYVSERGSSLCKIYPLFSTSQTDSLLCNSQKGRELEPALSPLL